MTSTARRTLQLRLAGAVCLIAAGGCAALTGRTAGEHLDDATLTASVKSQLVATNIEHLGRIDVDAQDGVIYLRGLVESPTERARAEELAQQVQGVQKVVNDLQVRPVPTAVRPAGPR